MKKKKLQKYQNSGPIKDVGFIPSINSIFQQGLGISPVISNPTGNPFGTNIFGDQLTKGIFDTGQLFKGMPQLNQLETPLGEWGGDVAKNIELGIIDSDKKKYGVSKTAHAAQAWANEYGQKFSEPSKLYAAYTKSVQDRAGQQYDNTIAAQKTWNEYGKPLAANMAAMDQLTKMQDVEYMKGNKRALYDVTDDMKGMESKGIFQMGGAPQISALQQALGYKDNSPFKKLPSQTILRNMSADGVNITMDGVSKNLYLIPDKGRPVLAQGNSGEYYFPNANVVEEIPAMEDGGIPDRYKEMGFSSVNTPKRTPGASKSHAVVIKDNGDYRLIRFGQQGVSGSPKKEGESEADKNRRASFKARHAANIAKGKTSAAYWANKVKWTDGGQIPILNLSKNINPMRLNPRGIYKMGGLITEGSEYNKRKQPPKNPISGASSTGPMGPKDIPSYDSGIRAIINQEKNEIIPTENLIPIQTEKGEFIVLPTGDVVPVMAKKRHHQMDEDEVTDVAPEGAYVLSSFGRVKIKKKEAENVITETGVKPYKLGIGQETPTERTLGDIMTKKEMAPAEVGKLISNRFPVIATSNPYEAAANTENKINRRPYLEGLIQLSEFDKMRKGIDTSTPEATREYSDSQDEGMETEEMMDGGSPMYRDNISHAPIPLAVLIPAISGLVQAGTNIFGAYKQKKSADQAYRDVLRLSNQSAERQRGQLGLGAAAGILGTLSQDPTVNAAYLNPTYINQMQTRTPSQITDSIVNTAFANMPTFSNLAPQQQILASQAAWGQALKAAGDARMNAWAGDRAARNQQLQSLQQYYDTNENNRVAAQNATRLNRNQQIGNVGDRTQGYFDSTATIEANLGQTQANARLGQASAQQQAIRSYTQGINQAIGTAGAAAYDLYANKSTPIGTNTTRLDQPALNSYPQTTLQPSPDCMWIGGRWLNKTTGLPC